MRQMHRSRVPLPETGLPVARRSTPPPPYNRAMAIQFLLKTRFFTESYVEMDLLGLTPDPFLQSVYRVPYPARVL